MTSPKVVADVIEQAARGAGRALNGSHWGPRGAPAHRPVKGGPCQMYSADSVSVTLREAPPVGLARLVRNRTERWPA